MTHVLRLACACVLLLLGLAGCHSNPPAIKAIRSALGGAAPTSLRSTRWKLVQQVYRDRDYRPIWTTDAKLNGTARDFLETLCHAEREGLRASDYNLDELSAELTRLHQQKDPAIEVIAMLDLQLTQRFLDYGADLLAGRLDPHAVDNGWYIRSRRGAIDSLLRTSLRSDSFDNMIAPLRPLQHEYKEMVKALQHYREIQEQGGWPIVPGGTRLVRGAQGPAVLALRKRLDATDDLSRAGGKSVYDDELAAAVARFQERHGIPVDSAVGPATLKALNIPIESRIRQIELNLERYRWLPSDFGKRYILVNIPDYRLYAYDDGKEVLTMRVIVGDEYGSATPVFADSMTYLVFRPRWDIPRRILVDEVIPKVQKDIYYLAKHGYEVVDTTHNEVITDPSAIDWSNLDTNEITFRVRQKAGTANALGNVKFMFPNQFSVYLHDTPADNLFDLSKRTLSHGCVRVEDPVKLAGYVLARQGDWNEAKIRETIAPPKRGEVVTPILVDLEHPVPVYLVYLTAFMRDGVLQFRDDPYGKDSRVLSRMGKAAPEHRSQCEQLEDIAKD